MILIPANATHFAPFFYSKFGPIPVLHLIREHVVCFILYEGLECLILRHSYYYFPSLRY